MIDSFFVNSSKYALFTKSEIMTGSKLGLPTINELIIVVLSMAGSFNIVSLV